MKLSRQVEILVMSISSSWFRSDTTETDFKQRREIVAGTVHYVDQVSMCVCLSVSLCHCVFFTYSSVLYTFLSFLHTCIFTKICIYVYNVAPVCELNNIRHGL